MSLLHDAERRSIERSLHDGVQQQLVGLAADLERAAGSLNADPESARELLEEMRRDMRQVLEDARTLAERISPPLLERGGLVPALRSAAARAGVQARIEVEAGTAYSPEIALMVYACCLDLVEHTGAGALVTIALRNEEDALAFEIGIDRDLDLEGLPVRDRCEALGGRIILRAESDHRTRVIGTVPLSGWT